MKSHQITLTETVSEMIEAQIASGRFTDFSSAAQEALWNYFVGAPSPFREYGVTPKQVERRYRKDRAEVKRLCKAGQLKEWKP